MSPFGCSETQFGRLMAPREAIHKNVLVSGETFIKGSFSRTCRRCDFWALARDRRPRIVYAWTNHLREFQRLCTLRAIHVIVATGEVDLPDQRKHRGPHPQDPRIFAVESEPNLRDATHDLNWLLTRRYASNSALKLVGDRYSLNARQRLAIARCACGDYAVARRQQHQVRSTDLQHQDLWIDGFNVLTSVEAALSGGVILHARDGCYRDMASMHGSYRKVEETIVAVNILGELISDWNVRSCRWFLDEPVSNSGRLKTMLRVAADERGWRWQVQLVPDPDLVLIRSKQILATADSQILDKAQCWFNLARVAIDSRVRDAWILDLSG